MDIQTGPSSSPPTKKRFGRTQHPVYRNVRQRSNGKWVCEVREPRAKSRIWLGTFPTAEMAAVAHDVAMLTLHDGDDQQPPLNFPDHAHLLPRAASCSNYDIQCAAQQAAREFNFPANDVNCGSLRNWEGSEEGFVDEEEVFNMPALIDDMAEGLLLAPPALTNGFSWSQRDCEDDAMDLTLWNF